MTSARNLRYINGLTRIVFVSTVCAIFFFFYPPYSIADNERENGITIIVTEVRSLSLETSGDYLSPDSSQWANGSTDELTWNIEVSSNTDWILTIRGTDDTWQGAWAKPVGDITWESGSRGYIPLTTEPVEVISGGPADHLIIPVQYKVALSFEKDIPGDYTYPGVVFEISSP